MNAKPIVVPAAGDVLSSAPDLSDYPIREYVASMAAELAAMALEDGDGLLAQTLEVAAQLARRPA
ncbi:MAG: hypothetical protein EON90_01150 [Brevundimonas sp.]|nr:MAG: hypothetical protein EON90_01150 [Brevundimonas sp.]